MTAAGTLYLIPAALGETDWSDYQPQGTRNLCGRLQYFVVENAKTARAELKRIDHPTPLREISIEQLPEKPSATDIERLLQPLRDGHDVGVLSEAGCPGVADPGALLVRRAHEIGLAVRPLVGPSSLLLALMGSGLEGQRFAFHGYLPAREPERSRRITELERDSMKLDQTQIFIETPYRNMAMFDALLAAARASSRLCVASDLTLPTEMIRTRTIGDWRGAERPALDKRPTVFLLLG